VDCVFILNIFAVKAINLRTQKECTYIWTDFLHLHEMQKNIIFDTQRFIMLLTIRERINLEIKYGNWKFPQLSILALRQDHHDE
jgi:hypothetical protein